MKRAAMLAVLCAAGSASAQPLAGPPVKSPEAAAHFDRGRAMYKRGQYAAAIQEFERARAIESLPDFDFALGQAYRKSGDCKRAMRSYNAVLDSPHPPDSVVAQIHDSMAKCLSAPSEAAPEPEPEAGATTAVTPARAPASPDPDPSTTPPAAHDTPSWYYDIPGGVLAGAGVASLAVGATYLALAQHDVAAANHATTVAELQTQGATADHERIMGTVGMVTGGALAGAAIVRYALVARDHHADRGGLAVTVAPSGAYAVWSGRF